MLCREIIAVCSECMNVKLGGIYGDHWALWLLIVLDSYHAKFYSGVHLSGILLCSGMLLDGRCSPYRGHLFSLSSGWKNQPSDCVTLCGRVPAANASGCTAAEGLLYKPWSLVVPTCTSRCLHQRH